MQYIAKDVQLTMKRLGVNADFTPSEEDGKTFINSTDFDMQPMIFQSIRVKGRVHIERYETSTEISVYLKYEYRDWNNGENGTSIGSMEYRMRKDDYDNDVTLIDGICGFSAIEKKKGLTI